MTAREHLRGDTVDVWFDRAEVRPGPGGGIDLVVRLGPEPAGSPVTLRLRFDGTRAEQVRHFARLLAGTGAGPATRTIGVLAVALAPATGDWLSFGVLPDTGQLLGDREG